MEVCKIALVIMNVDNETNEDEYDNDFQGGRWCKHWKLQGNNEEDPEDKVDDDEAKVVVLTHRNEKHYNYDDDNFIILISLNENENDEKLHENQTPWL